MGVLFFMTSSVYVYWKIRLQRIYKNQSTVNEAIQDMQNPNKFFINTNDAEIKKMNEEVIQDPETYQYNTNGSDDLPDSSR